MHIAVLGLEDFGFHLACTLSQLGDDIMAVDRDESRVQEIMRHVHKAVVADVSDREALQDLGIRGMDVVAVDVGARFEVSVLLTHHLRELNIPRILVKVANEDQGKILTMIGASDVVQPEREIAVKTAHLIHYSRLKLLDAVAFGEGYFAITLQVPASLVGRRLGDLDILERYRVQVIAIKPAAAKTVPFMPTLDYVLLQDDLLMVMGEEAKLVEIHQKWK